MPSCHNYPNNPSLTQLELSSIATKMNNTQWIGIEASGTLPVQTHITDLDAPKSRLVVEHLARFIAQEGIKTFEISIGFWIPTRAWRWRVEAREPVWSKFALERLRHVQEKFADVVWAHTLQTRSIDDPQFGDWKDWVDECGRWRHASHVSMYRGIAFLEKRDGELWGDEIRDLLALKVHDLQVKGPLLGSSRLAPGRVDCEAYFEMVMRELVGDEGEGEGEGDTGEEAIQRSGILYNMLRRLKRL